MSYYELLKSETLKGKKGLNKGIPFPKGWDRIKKYLPNIQRKYYLLSADSGVGKTKLSNFLFLYNPFFQWLNGKIEDVEIFYFSCEMPPEEILAEFVALYLFVEKGILTDIDEIYSNGEEKIKDDIYQLINSEAVRDIINKFEDKVTIINEKISPGFLYKKIMNIAKSNGEIITKKVSIDDDNGKAIQRNVFDKYIPKNKNKWNIIIFDNFQKLTHKKTDLRNAIVDASQYLDIARLHFGFVVCGIQQINRNSKSFDRYKFESYFPSEQDLKDSEAPFHDCQVAITQISPFKLGLKTFEDYNVSKDNNGLKDRLRAIKVIKNRGGTAYGTNCYLFLGENSVYKELPYANDLPLDYYKIIKNKYK